MKARLKLISIAVAILLVLWGLPARPQTSAPGQAELQQALQLADNSSRVAEAVPLLESISQAHQGTELDAMAQLQLAWTVGSRLNDLPRARQIYSQVAARFHDTRFEYMAAVNLLDAQLFADGLAFDEYLRGLDSLIVRAGGPSLSKIRSGQRSALGPAALGVGDQGLVLGGLYMTAAGRMNSRPDQSPQLVTESLNLYTYARDTLSPFVGEDATRDLQIEVLTMHGQLASADFPPDRTAPRITKIRPEGTTGRRSDIVAQLNDGPIYESQLNVQELQLTVDGVKVAPALFSKTSRKFKSGSNKVFQKTKVRYRPLQSLAPGSHHVALRVSDLAGNPVERSWSFTVRDGHKDDRDDDTGDDRCDQEPEDGDD